MLARPSQIAVWLLAVIGSLAVMGLQPASAKEDGNVYTDFRLPLDARLTDSHGKPYSGTATFNPLFVHGEVAIQGTPYGRLEGRYSMMPPERGTPISNPVWNEREKFPTPLLSAHTEDWPMYGLVYLYAGKRLVVRCHVGGRQTVPTGNQMLFGKHNQLEVRGICADEDGRRYNIAFGNVAE